MRRRGNGGNVQNLQRGVAGRFKIDDFGLGGQALFKVLHVHHVDESDFHAELGHAVVQKGECAAIQRVAGQNFVPRHHGSPQCRGDGAHAGGGGERGLAIFQGGELHLDQRQRRI
ncbi:hypothetical protein SDC9_84416 [bioreactor metagenome]|uniref:Uncharacterized protein n=1 Tax=bioreactor metagenome TaxID=1076179 RepID=A0A644ZAU0_9ZZZZ